MKTNNETLYPMETSLVTKTKNGATKTTWCWCGWYTIPNLNDANVKVRGKYLYHDLGGGEVDRYDLSSAVYKDYTKDIM